MTRIARKDDGPFVRRVTWIGLVVNVVMMTIKFIAGVIGHSQALIADAIHSASDFATDIAVLVGSRFWNSPPDMKHPNGHRRFETLISLGIGIAVIVVGVFIAINAIETLWKGIPSHPSAIVGVCALLSVISKEWLFRYTRAAGRKIRSQALEANAWHHRSDALSSIPVVIAVILTYVIPGFHYFDTLGALFVAILVAKSGVDIAWPGLIQVSDAGASAAITEKMLGIAREVPGVISVHDFRSRYIGNDLQVNLHIVVDAGMTLLAAHDLSEEVERRLIDCGENVTDALVHVDPYDPSKAKED